jgi:hypothetical protein
MLRQKLCEEARIAAGRCSGRLRPYRVLQDRLQKKSGSKLPHSKTNEYLVRILLWLAFVVKGKCVGCWCISPDFQFALHQTKLWILWISISI